MAFSSFEANLVVFFITNGLSLNCPPQPGARGKRRSRSKNGIALWGQPLGMQDKRKGSRSKRLKPIKRRRFPRSGRAKERPFFGSFFGRAKKEHTPRPGAKRKLDCTKPWFRKKYYKISFKGGKCFVSFCHGVMDCHPPQGKGFEMASTHFLK